MWTGPRRALGAELGGWDGCTLRERQACRGSQHHGAQGMDGGHKQEALPGSSRPRRPAPQCMSPQPCSSGWALPGHAISRPQGLHPQPEATMSTISCPEHGWMEGNGWAERLATGDITADSSRAETTSSSPGPYWPGEKQTSLSTNLGEKKNIYEGLLLFSC